MANMSHCRFTNTFQDLAECYEHIDDDDLCKEERRARHRLIKLCANIAAECLVDGEPIYACEQHARTKAG